MGFLLDVPTFSFEFQFYLMFTLFWLWCEYWNLLYNHQRYCFWLFVHPSACLVVQNDEVLSGPEFILFSAVTTVGFGVCGCTLYFSCWLPFLPHDTLVTGVFSASPFLTVLAWPPVQVHQGTCHPLVPTLMKLIAFSFNTFPIGHLGELCSHTCLPPDLHGAARVNTFLC